MIRIIHVSDFHLNSKNLKDWNDYVKSAFLTKINEFNSDNPITLIACTGDLCDKGGSDYDNISDAFTTFEKEIINPICEEISLEKRRFVLTAGNHDIVRSADDEPIDMGYISYFKKEYSNISKFMLSALNDKKRDGINRIVPYKKFEEKYYGDNENSSITIFGSSHKYNSTRNTLGVSSLNSAWRAYNVNDKDNLIVGEDQLNYNSAYIEKCDIKIALMHHPIDWLISEERQIISNHISKDYDILLFGHVHENSTSYQTGFNGSLFINLAPAYLSDIRAVSKAFSNGFTLIDYDIENRNIECKYFKYDLSEKSFVLNTEVGDEGVFFQQIPEKTSGKERELIKRLLSNIESEHFAIMNEHLIAQKAQKNKDITTLKEGFIMPPIDEGNFSSEGEETKYINLNDIVKSIQNITFFGSQEIGKTTLLYRLVFEYVDEFVHIRKIPVYLDFDEIGNKDIITCIKEYLRCNTSEAKQLLINGTIVLLLDNIRYSSSASIDNLNKIHRFNEEYEHIRIISSSATTISGVTPMEYVQKCKIPFKKYFIRNLRTKHVKSIIKLWLPEANRLESETRLQKIVDNFNSYSLPCTAMSVSLFLWSTENHDRKPINNAVLLDIYIELILEKLNENNIYRATFDYRNKCLLISAIAQEMLIKDDVNYCITNSEYLKVIEDYLRNKVGFDYDSNKIAEYFLERKIFSKCHDNKIKFSKTCFFHFFLAKRMEYNAEFKGYVLEEENYFNFEKEIDYYSGLIRNDEELLKLIYNRFSKEFEETDSVLDKIAIDEYFTLSELEKHQSIAEKIEVKDVKANRPSEEKLEEFYNNKLSQVKNPNEILKKTGKLSLEKLLILMCNVLRNSEGVENLSLKKEVYYSTIKYSIIWSILYRELIVFNLIENNKIPLAYLRNYSFEYLVRYLPYHVQQGLFLHLGTYKLSPIVLDKVFLDIKDKKSEIESFFSVALYSDIQGKDFPKYLKSFIKRIDKKKIAIDYTFKKLIDYYYRRTKVGSSNEELYLELLSDVKIKHKSLPRRMKEKIKDSFKSNKATWINEDI